MKIVHVLPTLGKGGAERVVADLANAAVAEGHQVSLLLACPVDSSLLQDQIDPRVELRFVGRRRSRLGVYASFLGWFTRNRQWLMSWDVIHCHLTFGSIVGSAAYLLRGRRAAPVIVETYHSVGMAIPALRRRLDAALARQRDAVALMANDSFWSHFRANHSSLEIRLIPNGVCARSRPTAKVVEAYRHEIGIPVGTRVIGSVGRLVHERRPDALLEAFAAAAGRMTQNVHLLLGGEGPERATLAARAQTLGIGERVHLPGLVRDPAPLLELVDLYLTVNVGDSTGVAAMEAAMRGLPIVAFQMLGVYRPAGNEWIWSARDIGALADRIVALVEDRPGRDLLAKRQRSHAIEHHSLARMARAYESLYQDLLAAGAEGH
jgi:glycosyltransferase involved in cell wall biosynthesis